MLERYLSRWSSHLYDNRIVFVLCHHQSLSFHRSSAEISENKRKSASVFGRYLVISHIFLTKSHKMMLLHNLCIKSSHQALSADKSCEELV